MTRWTWGAGALWLVVVIAGSGLAWVAIDEVGRGVNAVGPPDPITGSVTTGPAPTESPSAAPTTPSASSSTASPSSSPTSDDPTPTPPTTKVRTWTGTAGTVTVSCTGAVGRLIGASPADGWRGESGDPGEGLEVKFARGETEITVEATCGPDGPVFRSGNDD